MIDIGLSSTDQLWFASGWLDLPGAMFTASHNPCGIQRDQVLPGRARSQSTSANLAEIAQRARAQQEPTCSRDTRESSIERDVLPAYADHLHSLVDLTGIRRLRVVADAGNGMAGLTLPAVLNRRILS